MDLSTVQGPLGLNLKRQLAKLLQATPSSFASQISPLFTQPNATILGALSKFLAAPPLTSLVADLFLPLLVDLCARWLDEQLTEDHFVAICFLVEPHEELYDIFFRIISRIEKGPLSLDQVPSHRVLLAYYRILSVNPQLPQLLNWPVQPLSHLIWNVSCDRGVKLLSIYCYAAQCAMAEVEREKMEIEILGEKARQDCLVDGHLDGWVLPALEIKRVSDARNASFSSAQDFYAQDEHYEPILPTDICPHIADVAGLLFLKSTPLASPVSQLVPVPSSQNALRLLAAHFSRRIPILLSSSPSSGKTLLITHLSSMLHPEKPNQVVTINLADTSLDPRSLMGSYASSPTQPGVFEWKEGVLVRAMREGKWVVLEDIDRASNEVLGMLKPLAESLKLGRWIGGRAEIHVPSRGKVIAAHDFALIATRSVTSPTTFFGASKYYEIVVPTPSEDEIQSIIAAKHPKLSTNTVSAIIRLWRSVKALGSTGPNQDIGLFELEKLCRRFENTISSWKQTPNSVNGGFSDIIPNVSLREELLLEVRDVLFGRGSPTAAIKAHVGSIASLASEHLGLDPDRRDWVLYSRTPSYDLEKDVDGRVMAVSIGSTRIPARFSTAPQLPSRPFAMHKPAIRLLSRIATGIALNEPILLTGETGTGKTSAVTHLASVLHRPLVSLNLSQQTESSDLIGGFKPIDTRIPAAQLQERFLDLFAGTFSRKKNANFEESVRKAVSERKWKRAVGLWKEAVRLATDRLSSKLTNSAEGGPRKRQRTELTTSRGHWEDFGQKVDEFEVQHVQGKGKFAFSFVEGPLVRAVRAGDWVLLDEINLASPECLECISGLLRGPSSSITLTEEGSLEPIPRHPDFRLFACMNPATDVGKKDLPPNIRSRFTEIDVPPPDADRETLLSIITQYIGHVAVGDKAAIMNVAEFYASVKQLSESRQIVDGSNHRPHYSMRTLARALTFAADIASVYSLRRALWEGCFMAFTMVLDGPSTEILSSLARKHLLTGIGNLQSLLSKVPPSPGPEFVKFGPFYLEKGPYPLDEGDDYILTPSVELKLVNLARIILTRRFPVLIEGPTSSGKTSSIEYLARRTGHRFIRINNHEHTDIQEYLGSYVSDPTTGKLVFKDGLLVQALRNGDWIVLDELNLAPTDVLEALNRLLDDNRELVIPETQEILRPHPHFMLFATQNPPGLYAGRKVLSRAFRNRFLEVHFEDVPRSELEAILCQRCRIAPSYGAKIVAVFLELQKHRQSSRVFESKHGFATLRDLFRWAGRDAVGYEELAENGYMLLAERSRRDEDKQVVKEVIESIMKVKIDEASLYNLFGGRRNMSAYLGCPLPSSTELVWTTAMQRLFVLLGRALRFNEPVLLVGETGCGKTSVCQVYAESTSQTLHSVNCHQNTETADLIGGLRPVRNRPNAEATLRDVSAIVQNSELPLPEQNFESLLTTIDKALQNQDHSKHHQALNQARCQLLRLRAIFEWQDGPLIEAMQTGGVFLLDEISLADDSVLERLNSVLEPQRAMILAERGGDSLEKAVIQADKQFKLVATMNPGGDYGKKELSPALRNRFTEIWVPPVRDRHDLELIVSNLWASKELEQFTQSVLEFSNYLGERVGDHSICGLRDILAWVHFSNAAFQASPYRDHAQLKNIFHHAAYMSFLDGLSLLPQLSSYSSLALRQLKAELNSKLQSLVPISTSMAEIPREIVFDPTKYLQLGPFALSRGPEIFAEPTFNLQAPTSKENFMRVMRACQLAKPIMLEGSPGVGKTSLVTALAAMAGHRLCRINLSDQTDLVDLFGSDLPVEGGGPGEFAWKDAEFLTALQEGHWVLLDEMNLAPQPVLEGLNAVLDHRGTVYIPELNRSFSCHPRFRIFAAQNPLGQGGGRKGLPRSFLNRFTKVYIEELSPTDLLLVCSHLFPTIDSTTLQGMIAFNASINEECASHRLFGRDGSPWEFNLRDVIRWATLMSQQGLTSRPEDFVRQVYIDRFRTPADRDCAMALFKKFFPESNCCPDLSPHLLLTPSRIAIGHATLPRAQNASFSRPPRALRTHLQAAESISLCVSNSWLTVVTGPSNSGKNELIQLIANCAGQVLQVVPIHASTDTLDILGSFEQVGPDSVNRLLDEVGDFILKTRQFSDGSRSTSAISHATTISSALSTLKALPTMDIQYFEAHLNDLIARLTRAVHRPTQEGNFEWIDGPLVDAMRKGHWVLLDGANTCNPAVLDRLNSLCEPNGVLTLSERGYVSGSVQVLRPHPSFRLFMTVDPQYGELSRAMRNRGLEIHLGPISSLLDLRIIQDELRLPLNNDSSSVARAELTRRGLLLNEPRAISCDAPFSSLPLIQHSFLSTVMTYAQVFTGGPEPAKSLVHYIYRTATPLHIVFYDRLFGSLSVEPPPFWNMLQTGLAPERQHELIKTCRANNSDRLLSEDALPMDFYLVGKNSLNSVISDNYGTGHGALYQVLELAVHFFLYRLAQSPGERGTSNHVVHRDELEEVVTSQVNEVQERTLELAENMLAKKIQQVHGPYISLALNLLSLVHHLSLAVYQSPIDFSAVYALTQWIEDALSSHTESISRVWQGVASLRKSLALTAGHGLMQLWEAMLTVEHVIDEASLSALDIDIARLVPGEKRIELRRQSLQLMSLKAIPQKSNHDRGAIIALFEQVKATIDDQKKKQPDESVVHPIILLAELETLSHLTPHMGNTMRCTQRLQTIIDIACQDTSISLSRYSAYQQVLWEIDHSKASLPSIISAFVSWIRAILSSSGSSCYGSGFSLILRPTRLISVFTFCQRDHIALTTTGDYEASLTNLVKVTWLDSSLNISREHSLGALLWQLILMVTEILADKSGEASIRSLNDVGYCGTQSFSDLAQSLADCTPTYLQEAFRDSFSMVLPKEASQNHTLAAIGRGWVALGRYIMRLYLPNTPIDPARVKQYTGHFWQERKADLMAQINLHSRLEVMLSGSSSNTVLAHLNALLAEVDNLTSEIPNPHYRGTTSRLHMFWTELLQFKEQVIGFSKVDKLMELLELHDPDAIAQEEVIQKSIEGFRQRISSAYMEYADIFFPFWLALASFQTGLGILASSLPANPDFFASAKCLVAFPTVRTLSLMPLDDTQVIPSITPCSHLVLSLSIVSFQRIIGTPIQVLLPLLQQIYDKLTRLWVIDKTKEKELEQTASSLYRQQVQIFDAITDSEREEQEFRELFPAYEEALDREPTNQSTQTSKAPLAHIPPSEFMAVSRLHQRITLGKSDPPSLQFYISRALGTLLTNHANALPESLDRSSLPIQLKLLRERQDRFTSTVDSTNYNFYFDSNIAEMKRVFVVLSALIDRLDVIIQEYPEQMVIQHLRDRCAAILAIDVMSPLAKVITMLEQLLVQTDDWEMYASRQNTLKRETSSLIALIVDWRRLELVSWKGLLTTQLLAAGDRVSEWFFRLYEAAISGPRDAHARERSQGTDALTNYLADFVPLLNDFVTSSTLGEFTARMDLLSSFVSFCGHLAAHGTDDSDQYVMQRVHRILASTYSFYSLFSSRVTASLTKQRVELEKEVHALIKLASWKDINVHALKASAQRTHHQLYKIIRKFREILQQPVTQYLHSEFANEIEASPAHLDHPSSILDTIPQFTVRSSAKEHLNNLGRTYTRFRSIVSEQIQINSHSQELKGADELSVDVIVTSQELSNIAIHGDTAAQRDKNFKALLVRKRKAWSDLLKELKRSGLPFNPKHETIKQHTDELWMREQPIARGDSANIVKCENYFNRLVGILPEVRGALASHHNDLTTRELQRGVMFADSLLSFALEARKSLHESLSALLNLQDLRKRLHEFVSIPIHLYSQSVLSDVVGLASSMRELVSALEETIDSVHLVPGLGVLIGRDFTELSEKLQNLLQPTQELRQKLEIVEMKIALGSPSMLLQGEHDDIRAAIRHSQDVSQELQSLELEWPEASYLLTPLREWVQSKLQDELEDMDTSSLKDDCDLDFVIEAMLISAQDILALHSQVVSEANAERYIQNGQHRVLEFTRRLHLHTIVADLTKTFSAISSTKPTSITAGVSRILPFLDLYAQLAEEQLQRHSFWTKSLFKLELVLCTILRELMTRGFCKPPEMDEDGSGEGTAEVAEGTGLGEGTGQNNVSKEIEDESQVEGLRGEDETEDQADKNDHEGGDAIEMENDFGGKLEDVPDDSDAPEESDQGSDQDPDEQLGELDPKDSAAVDEKLWGDEQGPKDGEGQDDQVNEDRGQEDTGDSEMVAKEGEKQRNEKGDERGQEQEQEQEVQQDGEQVEEQEEGEGETDPNAPNGAPMEDHIQDANTLDLPDDMDLDLNEATKDGVDEEMEDDDIPAEPSNDDQRLPTPEPEEQAGEPDAEDSNPSDPMATETEEGAKAEGDQDDSATAQADISTGLGGSSSNDTAKQAEGDPTAAGSTGGTEGREADETTEMEEMPAEDSRDAEPGTASENVGNRGGRSTAGGEQSGQSEPNGERPFTANPLRSLGDALKEVRQRFDEILENKNDPTAQKPGESTTEPSALEYLLPEDKDTEMQALGSAGEEKTAKLNDLNLISTDAPEETMTPMDIDTPPDPTSESAKTADATTTSQSVQKQLEEDVQGAITQDEVFGSRNTRPSLSEVAPKAEEGEDTEMEVSQDLEVELREWQSAGFPSDQAGEMWRKYESLTHDYAYALCEQLRLILAPSLATRLKGDYRTGKRLNMKKIIPYIASDYTKDKIWLRRTRPSQREYQILIALDDSRSMAESHSIHLAYQTLALVSGALARLEAGDIAIAKFGKSVEMVRGFDEGGHQLNGSKIIEAFQFNQQATDVLSLVQTSLQVLEAARERKSSASSAELWQLEIIISDGICQDHDRLRTVLRKAEEQRVMIVFIIIDSLHNHTSQTSGNQVEHSILSMTNAKLKMVGGRVELETERYLDSFPFEYYVVLRDVEALPEVLSSTLKQFFERISGD